MSRAGRRIKDKRAQERQGRQVLETILELDQRDISPAAIGAKVGLPESFITEILTAVHEIPSTEEGGGG